MLFARFVQNREASVLPIFALAVIPIFGLVGAGIDYARAAAVRSEMQGSIDAAAIMLAKEANGLTTEQIQVKADAYFNAMFNRPEAGTIKITPVFLKSDGSFSLQVTGTGSVRTKFMNILGKDKVDLAVSTDVVWGMKRLELALALDVTGSMDQQSRMVELKKATKALLLTLKNAAQKTGDVKVSLVPFASNVNVKEFTSTTASLLDWTDWEDQPAIIKTSKPSNWDTFGPRAACPFTKDNHGFECSAGPASRSNDANIATIPSSGSTNGLICPTRDSGGKSSVMIGRYYNGCYNSIAKASSQWKTVCTGSSCSCGSTVNCSCSGSGSGKSCKQTTYNHTWVPNARTTWDGCVRDREQSNDVSDTTPTSSAATKFQPFQNFFCPDSALPLTDLLTSGFSTLNNKVDNLDPLGATNITIGLEWGWHSITASEPMTQGAAPNAELDKVVILMTDGDNTINRWSGNGSSDCTNCDARTALACSNIKATGVKVYSIRMMEGNEALLKACATSASMYYNVEQASQLNAVFTDIADKLANLRIAK